MKSTYELLGPWPTVMFWTALFVGIAIKFFGLGSNIYLSAFLLVFVVIFCLCAIDVNTYVSRSILLKDPHFKLADLEYKSKHELMRLEQHARIIGDQEKALLIAEYAAQSHLS